MYTKTKVIIALFLFFCDLAPIFCAKADYVPHIIINEVQTAGSISNSDDFIELYNPTDVSQNLSGWSVQKVSSTFNYATLYRKAIGDLTIAPYGFLLVISSSATDATLLATKDVTAATTWSDNNGFFLVNDNVNITDAGDTNIIDAVGLGNFPTLTGFSNIANPSSGNSVLRKFINGVPAGFILKSLPTPQGITSGTRTLEQMAVDTNESPIAEAGDSQSMIIGSETSLDGSLSNDPEGGALTYLWDLGGGNTSTETAPKYTFNSIGVKTVTLTVTDPQGGTGTDTVTITIQDRPPVYVPPPADIPNVSAPLVTAPLVTGYQNQYSNKIKVLEFLPDPIGSDTGLEYIKLTNSDDHDLNLRNWLIDDEEGGSKPYLIDRDMIVQRGVPIVIYSLETKISLNNDGDSVRLFDPDGKLIDSATYSGKTKEGIPYILKNGEWVLSDSARESPQNEATQEAVSVTDQGNDQQVKPNISNIQVTERPSVVLAAMPSSTPSPTIFSAPNSNILVDFGSVINTASVAKKATVVSQLDYSNTTFPITHNTVSPKSLWRSPYAVVPMVLVCLALTVIFIITPGEIGRLVSTFNKREDEIGIEIGKMFK